jgi:hypothetical protein
MAIENEEQGVLPLADPDLAPTEIRRRGVCAPEFAGHVTAMPIRLVPAQSRAT